MYVKTSADGDKLHQCLCYNCFNGGNGNPCLQPYHNTCMEMNAFVWKSLVHGFGLFSRKHLQPGDIVCLYSGTVGSSQMENAFTCKVDGEERGSTLMIDSSDHDNYSGRWINHSCVPNARLVVPIGGVIRNDKIKRYAIIVECVKEIHPCEEIFIDYGWEYFTQDKCLDPDYFYTSESRIVGMLMSQSKVYNLN